LHKIFAKPLFLGKKVLFLPQCHSTNEELSSLVKNYDEPEGLVVYSDHQHNGKGQRGNIWIDEAGKNVLMSILLKPVFLNPSKQYFLNLIVGLAVIDGISQKILDKKLSLKWPNDIYVGSSKVGGILIENNLKGNRIEHSIVGIGLNVNQNGFNLLNATSVLLETGSQCDRQELMEVILQYLEKWYLKLKGGNETEIIDAYHNCLLWKDELRTFKVGGAELNGLIRGIDNNGKLKLEMGSDIKTFNIKEIEFVR
jgi:BirA family transcriptional regulator, biotin operon repressor / biotin---[acetyl-CoA-carboxylase] ligase